MTPFRQRDRPTVLTSKSTMMASMTSARIAPATVAKRAVVRTSLDQLRDPDYEVNDVAIEVKPQDAIPVFSSNTIFDFVAFPLPSMVRLINFDQAIIYSAVE